MFNDTNEEYIEKASKQKKFTDINEKIKKMGSLKNNKLAYYSFLISVIFTSYLCSTFIGGSLAFIFNFPIYGFEFLAFPILTMIIFIFFLKNDKEKNYILYPILALLIYFGICIILIYFNTKVWDISSDTLGYHEPMIIALSNGWNPFKNPTFNHSLNIWDIHYPRANAIYATMIYNLTGNIESGKILSSLIPLLSSFWAFSFIVAICKNKKKSISIILGILGGLLILINPVNIEQCLTYYVDSTLGGMIIILIIMIFYLIFFKDLDKVGFMGLAFIVAFTSNIKFTGLIYSVALLGGMFIFYMIYEEKDKIKKLFIFLFWTFIFSVCIVGFNPYITNIIYNHNPFYPLIGAGSINIIEPNTPKYLLGKSNFIQYIYSLFANISSGVNSSGHFPHNFNQLISLNGSVMNYYSQPDPRLRGFGILSFIIEPMSFVLFVILMIQMIKQKANKFFITITIFLSVIIVIMTLVAGGYWWARYIPFYWILPSFIVILYIKNKSKIYKILGVILLIFMILNVLCLLPTFKWKIKNSNKFKNMIFNGDKILEKGKFGWETMKVKFDEFNIPYKIDG
ncbi:MAG: hypothetical protein ACRC57_07485 [Sarcina sp.]